MVPGIAQAMKAAPPADQGAKPKGAQIQGGVSEQSESRHAIMPSLKVLRLSNQFSMFIHKR